MKKEYDISESVASPYAKLQKKQVTIRLGVDVIAYFKQLSTETGTPYQRLINLYLQDCARKERKPKIVWGSLSEET